MNTKENSRKKKRWKALFALCIILGGVGLAMPLAEKVLLCCLLPDAASIGVIGGADGPTAVFVTTAVRPAYFRFVPAVLLLLGLGGLWYLAKRKQ